MSGLYPSHDEMTHGEMARILMDLRNDIKDMKHELVQKEVYESDKEALNARLSTLEQERTTTRNLAYAAMALSSIVIAAVGQQIAATFSGP